MTEREKALFSICHMTSIALKKLWQIYGCTESPEELLQMEGKELFELVPGMNLQEIEDFNRCRDPYFIECKIEECDKKKIRFLSFENESFPEKLKHIQLPPAGIFVKGKLPGETMPAAAVIGSRRCTVYGREMACFFGRELGKGGAAVISGMALGVDGFAQMGCIGAGAYSLAVLGGGVDWCYPRENVGLYTELCEKGGIISERPVGYHPRSWDFPLRNRLISGLSDAVVVIEASLHSGTQITVNDALSENREIFALPGRIQDRMSEGCNQLIKNGAQILTCPEDVLQYLGLQVGEVTREKKPVLLSKKEKIIYDLLSMEAKDIDTLVNESSYAVSELLGVLIQLEIRGLVRKLGSGYIADR